MENVFYGGASRAVTLQVRRAQWIYARFTKSGSVLNKLRRPVSFSAEPLLIIFCLIISMFQAERILEKRRTKRYRIQFRTKA